MSNDWVVDVETFPNVFTAAFEHVDAPFCVAYEISDWRNESVELIAFLHQLRDRGARLVSFNGLGFDWPILQMLVRMGRSDARTLYNKAQAIVGTQDDEDRWVHQVYPSDRLVPQIDLYKIHHFDNRARATGLKALEFAMRADSIEDLPFPVGSTLTLEQVPVLKAYNAHDVSQTKRFYHHSREMIAFREELCAKYPQSDWINFNDTKIGKQFFTMKLEESGVPCFAYGPEGRKPRQTRRSSIALKDAILPWIKFQHPEFNRVLEWLKAQTITETKGVFKDLTATVNGFTFVFGTGGIHGSVENEVVLADDGHAIIDLDVSSMYPNIAIANRFYPEHLGPTFCDIYAALYEQRKQHKKGSAINAMLKLALNGTYGDSNNPFSVFYDPLFTMKITISGQLLLCMLAETLMEIPGLQMKAGNTDGLTVRLPREQLLRLGQVCREWENTTRLTLEHVEYDRMFIRDVNAFVGIDVKGNVKRKGAYDYNRGWHQDHSALVIPKVAEQVLLHGAPIRETVENWPDKHDFFLRVKVPRTGYLSLERDAVETQQQNTSRYAITKTGGTLWKHLPPLKGKTEWRRIGVESGWLVTICNRIEDAEGIEIDYNFYITEIEKLVLGLR